MKTSVLFLLLLTATILPAQQPMSLYDFTMVSIDGKPTSLSAYTGKVVLVVNVASKCGLTPQYEGLEALYRKFKDKGFVILGFPANNFMGQEPGTDAEIQTFCTTKFDVTFPMFSKISVKGKDMHPLYQWLTASDKTSDEVKWNFHKYLIGKDGNIIRDFAPTMKPDDPELVKAIEAQL